MDQKNLVTDKNKDPLVILIEKSTQDLHNRVNMQKYILLNVLGRVKDKAPGEFYPVGPVVDEPSGKSLRKVLAETIEVLEETKKAFKSKRIEELETNGCLKGNGLGSYLGRLTASGIALTLGHT